MIGEGAAELDLEFADELGTENVFDHVGVAIDMARGDVGVLDEIGFPEPVIAGDAGRFAEARLGKAQATGWSRLEMIFATGDAKDAAELARRPGSLREEGLIGKGTIRNGAFTGLILEDLVDGPEKMLAVFLAAQGGLTEDPWEDPAGRGEEHADEEERGGDEDDDGTCGQLRRERADHCPEPSTRSSDER